jgi:hypothetical protein
VRRTLTLRWFRSDLTAENVALLQRERPEVTFVTCGSDEDRDGSEVDSDEEDEESPVDE